VVLGRISAEQFLGGEMRLDAEAARRAISDRIAQPLGLSVERAAAGILEIAVASMANAIRAVTTERGLDPRDFTLVAYGGGGPPHAIAVARDLAIDRVVIPPAPAHFSAFGMLMADVRRDYVLTHFARLADLDMSELEGRYRGLEEEGLEELRRLGIDPDRIVFERAADLRYIGQEHAVAVPVAGPTGDEKARAQIKQAFDEAHAVRFSHSAPSEPAELVSLRVSVFRRMDKPSLPPIAAGGTDPPADSGRPSRAIPVDDEPLPCAVFDRSRLMAGNHVAGPAIIEEPASSTVLRTGDQAVVSEWGHLLLQLGELQ